MPTITRKAARFIGPTLVVAGIALAVFFVTSKIIGLAHVTPHVGDIIAFTPPSEEANEPGTRLLVHRRDQFGCVLDLDVLRHSGGSLIVETDISGDGRNFGVHWAGDGTSADTGNCGTDADLLVDRSDMNILALSAVGYGAGRRAMPVVFGDIGN